MRTSEPQKTANKCLYIAILCETNLCIIIITIDFCENGNTKVGDVVMLVTQNWSHIMVVGERIKMSAIPFG